MASTLQKLLIPIFGYSNVSIPMFIHFIKELPYKYKHVVGNWNSGKKGTGVETESWNKNLQKSVIYWIFYQ